MMEPANLEMKALPRHEWPEELRAVFAIVEQQQLHPESVQVYYDRRCGYVWKSKPSKELTALLISRWDLSAVNKNNTLIRFALDRISEEVLQSSPDDDLDCYVSNDYLSGDKGLYCYFIHNKTRDEVLLRYYYNW